jgi:predicted phage terminase large subunit-like protein
MKDSFIKDLGIDVLCQLSFYDFVKQFWRVVVPAKPIWNWHIEYLCEEIQDIAERVFKNEPKEYDLIINVPPGSTKSTLVNIMLPAWIWCRMPEASIICASYSAELSESFSRKCLNLVQSARYRTYFPKVQLDIKRTADFTTKQGGERYAVGIGGSVTGKHADFVLIDDPINPALALSEAGRTAANIWMDETIATRVRNALRTPTIMIMQRLHQNDPTGAMLERYENSGLIKHICLPADIIEGQTVKPPEVREKYINGLLDPVRLSSEVLRRYKLRLGDYAFACQYDQSPVPRSGGLFRSDNLQTGLPPPDFSQKCRFWDRAASMGKGDYTVGVLMGRAVDGSYWVLDVVRGQWDTAERERMIKATAEKDGQDVPIGLEREPGSSGIDSVLETTRRLAGWIVFAQPASGSKEVRADSFSTQVNSRNVYLAQAHWNRDYIEELRYFPFGKHDDQVDASSGAFRKVCLTGINTITVDTFSFT